jgi:hypothetical protein
MTYSEIDLPERPRKASQRNLAPAAARRTTSQPSSGLWRRVTARPLRSFLQIAMLGSGTLIAMNALVFQSARHPSPWGGGIMSQSSMDLAPLPPSRPDALAAAAPAAAVPLPASAQILPKSQTAARETSRETTRDIARDTARPSAGRTEYSLSGMAAAPVPPASIKTAAQAARDPIGELIRSAEPVRSAATAARTANKPKPE